MIILNLNCSKPMSGRRIGQKKNWSDWIGQTVIAHHAKLISDILGAVPEMGFGMTQYV